MGGRGCAACHRIYTLHWQKVNSDRYNERMKKYRTENPNIIRPMEKRRKTRLRIRAIKFLGGRCVDCGCTDLRILNINHKNGNGGKTRPKDAGTFYRNILNGTYNKDEFDVMCYNDNILYEYERGTRSWPDDWPTNIDLFDIDGSIIQSQTGTSVDIPHNNALKLWL